MSKIVYKEIRVRSVVKGNYFIKRTQPFKEGLWYYIWLCMLDLRNHKYGFVDRM